jgi:hypothetical protein
LLGQVQGATMRLQYGSVIGPAELPGGLVRASARSAVISRKVEAISHSWRLRAASAAARSSRSAA